MPRRGKRENVAAAVESKMRLNALAEAHQRIFYFLMNSVARADDQHLAQAAVDLAQEHKKLSLTFKSSQSELI